MWPIMSGRHAAVAATASDGDAWALAELERAASRLCPPALSSVRDDIVQQAFMRARAAAGELGSGKIAKRYLWRAAYTVIVDLLRQQRAQARRDEGYGVVAPAHAVSPESAASASQIRLHVHDCVAALPDARRRAVALYLVGHGPAEIATLLGEEYKRIENLVLRGLRRVRECLERKGVRP